MKFRDIMSILVSLCMILTACQSANDSNIYSNATGVYADVTAEQCDGISTAEFHKMVPEETWQFAMVGYYFFWDADQKPCVAYWPAPDDTVYCQAFDPTRIGTSASDFAKIERGMTVQEVVALVGLPTRTATSGLLTMVFPGEEGEYCISWDGASDSITVHEINRLQ